MNSIHRQNQPLNPQIGFNVNSIQSQIQQLNPQMRFNVNSIQKKFNFQDHKWDSTSIPIKDRFNH